MSKRKGIDTQSLLDSISLDTPEAYRQLLLLATTSESDQQRLRAAVAYVTKDIELRDQVQKEIKQAGEERRANSADRREDIDFTNKQRDRRKSDLEQKFGKKVEEQKEDAQVFTLDSFS